MTLLQIIQAYHRGEFELTLEESAADTKTRNAYRRAHHDELERQCLTALGLADHEKGDAAWAFAWNYGHARGIEEVLDILSDLRDLLV